MGWIELLVDNVPDALVDVGAWIVLSAGIGAVLGLILTSARFAGNQNRNAKARRPTMDEDQAKEDAAVTAFERYMEVDARFRAMVSHQELPSRGRLH